MGYHNNRLDIACNTSWSLLVKNPKYVKIDEILAFFIFRLSFQEVRNQEIIGAGAQHDRKSLVDNTSRHLLAI